LIVVIAVGLSVAYLIVNKPNTNIVYGLYSASTLDERSGENFEVNILFNTTYTVNLNSSDFYILVQTNFNHFYSNQTATLRMTPTDTGVTTLVPHNPQQVYLHFVLDVQNNDNSWIIGYNGSANVRLSPVLPPFT
jgi:hypothetical protein